MTVPVRPEVGRRRSGVRGPGFHATAAVACHDAAVPTDTTRPTGPLLLAGLAGLAHLVVGYFYLVGGLVKAHGGTVTIGDAESGGACISVRWPSAASMET